MRGRPVLVWSILPDRAGLPECGPLHPTLNRQLRADED